MPRELSFNQYLTELLNDVKYTWRQNAIVLGGTSGSGGGYGSPPGGFVGQLPQSAVTGDVDELRVLSSGSATSLLWNLNRIRYWETVQFGTSAPTPTFAGQFWVDTSSGSQLNFRNATDTGWVSASSGSVLPNSQAVFTVEGVVSTGSGSLRIYNSMGRTVTISKVFLSANTAPTGADIIVDLNNNGSTVFSTQSNRPRIVDGANTGYTTTINSSSWADGQYLTFDRDQVGSGTPGSDLTVHVVYS